jgi:hypothetical protein
MPTYSGFIAIGDDNLKSAIFNSISYNGSNVLEYIQDFINFPSVGNASNKIEYTSISNKQLIACSTAASLIAFTDTNSTSVWSDSTSITLPGFVNQADIIQNSMIMGKGLFNGVDDTVMIALTNAVPSGPFSSQNISIYYNSSVINGLNGWTRIDTFIPSLPLIIRGTSAGNWLVLIQATPNDSPILLYNNSFNFLPVSSIIPSFDQLPGTYTMEYGQISSGTFGWIMAGDDTTYSLWKSGDTTGTANWTTITTAGSLFNSANTATSTRWNPRCMATDGGTDWVIGYSAGMNNSGGSRIGIVHSIDYGATFTDSTYASGTVIPNTYNFVCYGITYGTIYGTTGPKNYFVATGLMTDFTTNYPQYSILQSLDGGATWDTADIIPSPYTNQGWDVIYTQMDVVCLLKGSKVKTAEGYVPIETLAKGDTILMPNGLEREIVDIPRQTVPNEPHLTPYIIPAGKLGATEDLYISPTHSVFIDGKFIEAQFLGYKRASLPDRAIEYYNISLGGFRDELLDAQGVTIESLGKPFNGTEKPFYEKVAVRKDLSKDSIYPEDVRNGLIAKLQKESPYTVSELQTFSDQELRYILLGDNVDLL